jgi:hypothetical protein
LATYTAQTFGLGGAHTMKYSLNHLSGRFDVQNPMKQLMHVLFVLSVPLDTRLSLTTAQFRRLIEPLLLKNSHAKTESAAKYPVETKPFLPSLHEHLLVWDARQANSEIPDAEIADAVGLRINHVVDGETIASRKSLKLGFDDIERVLERRKKLSVQRHLRIAEQYIHYAGKGRFPLRYGR